MFETDLNENSVTDRMEEQFNELYNELLEMREKLKILRDIDEEQLLGLREMLKNRAFDDAEYLRITYLGVD